MAQKSKNCRKSVTSLQVGKTLIYSRVYIPGNYFNFSAEVYDKIQSDEVTLLNLLIKEMTAYNYVQE